ncbi:MAG: CvpA family protein [bacterium]|nr:CvpA family protein [bacterium]
MSIIDILVVILILICGVVGFKRGVFKQAVVTIGTVLVFVLSYHFKDYLANFFSYNLPFFNFTGEFAGLSSINIIMYQMIAFLIMFAFFGTILAVLIKITGIFEKILKFTIVLGIPSKILGLLLGLIEGYIVAFVFLFVITQPALKINLIEDSKFTNVILNSSPVLSNIVEDTENTIIEVYDLGKDYLVDKDADKFNRNSIDIMLKNKIITKEYVEKLIDKNKIKVNLDDILSKY